jgi:hypothetical protein
VSEATRQPDVAIVGWSVVGAGCANERVASLVRPVDSKIMAPGFVWTRLPSRQGAGPSTPGQETSE